MPLKLCSICLLNDVDSTKRDICEKCINTLLDEKLPVYLIIENTTENDNIYKLRL